MPIYEYQCTRCGAEFQELRGMGQADAPIPCPVCQSEDTHRVLSLFAAHSRSPSGEAVSVAASSGCSGCTATSCAGCKQ